MSSADDLKDEISRLRKKHIDRIQLSRDNRNYNVAIVYLNMLQESHMLLNNMRHQLRASKRFTDEVGTISSNQ